MNDYIVKISSMPDLLVSSFVGSFVYKLKSIKLFYYYTFITAYK
jgi:hypothetical protein